MRSKYQGYLVLKSLGQTDQEIVSNGVMNCMFVNNWALYLADNNKLKRLRFSSLKFLIENEMTLDEIHESDKQLDVRRDWYKKYATQLLQ